MKTRDDKVDDAVHAAMGALGLSPETCPDLADHLNEVMTQAALLYHVTDDEDEGGTRYVVRNANDDQLFWSKKYGWVEAGSETIFTEEERKTANLPIIGVWCIHNEG